MWVKMWLPNSPQTEDHGERARQLRLKSWFLLKTGDFTERPTRVIKYRKLSNQLNSKGTHLIELSPARQSELARFIETNGYTWIQQLNIYCLLLFHSTNHKAYDLNSTKSCKIRVGVSGLQLTTT